MNDEEGNTLVGKIIDLNVIAIEYFMQDQFKDVQQENGMDEIYYKELDTKEYCIKEEDTDQDELYLHAATIYLKDMAVTPVSMLKWTKVYLDIKGIPYSEFEETDFTDFADTNSFMNLLAEGARKMESKWGKEWWKKDNKP
jgi:hypothetical protein